MDGTFVDMVTYRVIKRGRKWLQAETPQGRPARIQIDGQSAAWTPGEAYRFYAKVKAFDFTVRATDKRIRRTDVFVLPEGYRPNKQERKATLRYCIGAILEGQAAGYVNQAAIRRGVAVGPADFNELQAEFEAAILAAATSKSTLEATDAISTLEQAENDLEREEARRSFHLALAGIERQAGSLAEWLKAKYARANHAVIYRKGEQLTLFAA